MSSKVVGETRLTISAAWASKQIDCTLQGILQRCHGKCCRLPSYWPPRVFMRQGMDGCGNLTKDRGCKWDEANRPIDCLLYPLIVNEHGKLVLHNRTIMKHQCCHPNYLKGPSIIEALEGNLSALFGAEQYARVKVDVLAGRDSYFDVPPNVQIHRAAEIIQTRLDLPPIARTEITETTVKQLQAVLDRATAGAPPVVEGEKAKAWWTK